MGGQGSGGKRANSGRPKKHADYSQSTPQSPLTKELQEYLAIDTAVSRLLLQTMRKHLSEMELQVVLPPSSDLKIEEHVTLVLGNQKVAKAIICS